MPSTTLLAIRNRIREHLGDNTKIVWSDAQIENAIVEAITQSWPHFYQPIRDESTYTGSGALAANTQSVAIPPAFLPNGVGSDPGMIFSIWARMTNGTETDPVMQGWFRLTKGLYLDYTDQATPKIRFSDPSLCVRQCELKIYGGIPIPPPGRYTFTAAASTDIFTITGPVSVIADIVNVGVPGIGNGATVSLASSDYVTNTLPTGVSANTTYYVVNLSGSSAFKLAATSGGAAINITTDGTGSLMMTSTGLTDGSSLATAYYRGIDTYLLYAASMFLHQSREKSDQHDRRGQSKRGLMAGQTMGDLAKKYRMARQHETIYERR